MAQIIQVWLMEVQTEWTWHKTDHLCQTDWTSQLWQVKTNYTQQRMHCNHLLLMITLLIQNQWCWWKNQIIWLHQKNSKKFISRSNSAKMKLHIHSILVFSLSNWGYSKDNFLIKKRKEFLIILNKIFLRKSVKKDNLFRIVF